jgi:hypothetical protein
MKLIDQAATFSVQTTAPGGQTPGAAVHEGATLQDQIDRAGAEGVELAPGCYLMTDSLRLRSGVSLRGHGRVILRRKPVVESELLDIVGYGHCEFRPKNPELFRPGMGVSITDQRSGGFGTTIARIVGEKNGTFFTDTPAQRDFRPSDAAQVRSIFPMIAGYRVEHVDLDGVIVDGEQAESSLLDGCRDAGVYFIGSRNVRLTRVEVRGYAGDAISFQQCVDVFVQDCHLHDNAGHGLHPGSGSVRYVMRRNHVRHNGGCGIYYCLRTTHSLCQENRIDGNTAAGISVGERDTDHLIDSNIIRNNGSAGIRLRKRVVNGADRLVVRRNVLDGNGAAGADPQVDIGDGIRQVVVENNAFAGASAVAVRVAEGCEQILVHRNFTGGTELPASAVESATPLANADHEQLNVGPARLPADGARHLGVVQLERWVDRCD